MTSKPTLVNFNEDAVRKHFLANGEIFELEKLQGFIQSISYQGFDPRIIRAKMFKIAAESKRDLLQDISQMIALVLERGTSTKSHNSGMSAKGKTFVTEMKNKYSIVETSSPPRDAITWGRVVAAFPEFAMKVAAICEPKVVVDGLPRYLSFIGACAVIPKSEELLLARHKEWSEKFCALINANWAKSQNIWKATQNSNLFTEDEKQQILNVVKKWVKAKKLPISSNNNSSEPDVNLEKDGETTNVENEG